MTKKYLSLEEAAAALSMPKDELNRLREKQVIRGFSDRGTWKFKQEDVESLARRRQEDSSPEVPLYGGKEDDNLLIDDDSRPEFLSDSDSDVRLVGEPEVPLGLDSDSDVKLVGMGQSVTERLGAGTDPEMPLLDDGSDSDVKLIRPDSDSDVKLPGDDSDSDVQLVGGATDAELAKISDSDINLTPDPRTSDEMTLVPDRGSVLEDDSGISLASDSSLMLGAESGINLEGPADSGIALDEPEDDEGITLDLGGDSGISLDIGDSGISLESAGDSGISLDDAGGGTIPMMNALDPKVPETQFEMASLEDSAYSLDASGDETGVLDLRSSGELDEISDATFNLDEEGAEEDAVEDVDLDAGGFGDEEDLDVFDADDDMFSGAESEAGFAASGSRTLAPVEQEWGMGTFVGLTLSSLLMLGVGAIMLDLVKNVSTSAPLNPASQSLVQFVGGLF